VQITSGMKMAGSSYGYYGRDYPSPASTYSGALFLFATNPGFSVNDLISVTGDITEYSCMTQFVVTSYVLDIEEMVEPAMPVSDPAVKTALENAGGTNAAEPYEGMLVKIESVSTVTTGDPWLTVTGGIKVRNDYSLSFDPDGVGAPTTFTSITGLVRFIVAGEYKTYYLVPRNDADIVGTVR